MYETIGPSAQADANKTGDYKQQKDPSTLADLQFCL